MNRLANETSPYLLQHAHNPVDWYAWGDEAFAKARSEDKPVFLSIGYSACHWCHVMERESFEDDATADLLNREFVSIKVDREERPDIDAIYMQAVQLMTGQGGWPMSMFLTPDARPFYAGTYFPPDDSRGMPSFKRVLKHVYETYKSRRNDVTEAAEEVQRAIAASMRIAGEKRTVDRVALERAATRIAQGYDAVNGGFGSAPKFPPSMTLDFLMQVSWRSGDLSLLDMVTSTLIKMARGGIYDQIGGGFHRYSVDAKWLVPHFEKMLYDNALLARLYTRAWQMTKGALFARVAHEVLSFIKREMTSPEGGFYSTLDADSEGEEGKFYAWSRAEVVEALGEDDAKAVCALYDITDRGNWEGKNIPNMPRDPKAVADNLGITVEQLSELASRSKAKLYEVRERRIRPGRDEKILTGWNGWMLAAFADAAAAFDRDEYRAIVRRNADFLIGRMTGDRIIRSGRIPGLLEDYAGAAWGLALAYEATHERRYLDRSRALAEQILTRFRDDAGGGFFDTPVDHEQLITRPKELFDNATPSGNSMTCEVLLRLALLFGEQRYADVATSTIDAIWAVAERYPSAFGFLLGTAEWREGQPKEIAISGPVDDERFRALRRIVGQTYLPHRVLVGGEASSDLPLLENRPHSKVVAYVCQAYACLEPTSDPDRLRVLIGAANAPGSAQSQGT